MENFQQNNYTLKGAYFCIKVKMLAITLNKKTYYNAVDIINEHEKLFISCKKSSRDIIKKMRLDDDDFIYAYYNNTDKRWYVKDVNYKKSKVLILTNIVDAYLEKYADNDDTNSDDESDEESSDDEEETEIKPLPSILKLKNSEKFRDHKDEIIEIDVRGVRSPDGCYFSADDVRFGFKMPSICKVILDERKSYKYRDHFVFFYKSPMAKNKNNRLLYLTFKGLLKLLYSSNNKNADFFQDWANNIIFTAKFGSSDAKQALCSNIMGLDVETVAHVFGEKKTNTPFICIYLFYIGTVGELRKKLDIPKKKTDDLLIFKCGQTINLSRRVVELKAKYKKDILLHYYTIVDFKYKNEAERYVREYLDHHNLKLDVNGENELMVITKKELNNVLKQYTAIKDKFSTGTHAINDVIDTTKNDYEHKLKDMKHDYELKLRDVGSELKDHMHKNEISSLKLDALNKEVEYLKKQLALKNTSKETKTKTTVVDETSDTEDESDSDDDVKHPVPDKYVAAFAKAKMKESKTKHCSMKEVYSAYVAWMNRNHSKSTVLGRIPFSRELQLVFPNHRMMVVRDGEKVFRGIKNIIVVKN